MTSTSDIIIKGKIVTDNPTEFTDKLEAILKETNSQFMGTVYRYDFTPYEEVIEDITDEVITPDEEKSN